MLFYIARYRFHSKAVCTQLHVPGRLSNLPEYYGRRETWLCIPSLLRRCALCCVRPKKHGLGLWGAKIWRHF